MSIKKIIQESINENPLEMKEAFVEEMKLRIAEAIAIKFDDEYEEIQEEAEQIDEISKATLGSYVKKASADQFANGKRVEYHSNKVANATGEFSIASRKKHNALHNNAVRKALNRDTGIDRAMNRLTKEDVEQIDELSKATLGSYIKKAGGTSLNSAGAHMADYGANSNPKAFKKGINRAKGVMKAVDRLTKESIDKHTKTEE